MNSQPEQDLQLRQEQLEAEINSSPLTPTIISQPPLAEQSPTNSSFGQSQLERCSKWFNSLSGFGKLIVVGVAAIVAIAILRVVLKLVAAVVSLAILTVLVYLAYRFFVVRSTETTD